MRKEGGRCPGWSFSSWVEEDGNSALEKLVRYPLVDVRQEFVGHLPLTPCNKIAPQSYPVDSDQKTQ